MRSIRFPALLAAVLLVACSGDDVETETPVDDTGTVGEETSTDTGSSDIDSTTDDSTVDSTTDDTGTSSDAEADADATTTETGSDAADGASDSSTDVGAETTTDATSETASDASGDTAVDAGSDSGTDTGADGGAKSCSFASGGCSPTEYCDMPTCDTGTCKPRPAMATKDYAPVCGCDGVTYWNASTAQITGHGYTAGKCDLTAGTTKFCGIKGCDTGEDCITDLTDSGMCKLGGFGKACWRLPAGASCPAPASDTPKVRECSGGTAGSCTGYCKGILKETSGAGVTGIFEDSTCP